MIGSESLIESTRADHRAAAERLVSYLLPKTGASVRLGISGVPGVGKSTFIEAFGNALVNQRSTTWRELPESERGRDDMELLADYPTLMKRPVIEDGKVLTLGWDKAAQAKHLG